MTRKHHPKDRFERKRLAEAKALEHFVPKRINGKKRKIQVDLKQKETEDELAGYRDGNLV